MRQGLSLSLLSLSQLLLALFCYVIPTLNSFHTSRSDVRPTDVVSSFYACRSEVIFRHTFAEAFPAGFTKKGLCSVRRLTLTFKTSFKVDFWKILLEIVGLFLN